MMMIPVQTNQQKAISIFLSSAIVCAILVFTSPAHAAWKMQTVHEGVLLTTHLTQSPNPSPVLIAESLQEVLNRQIKTHIETGDFDGGQSSEETLPEEEPSEQESAES